MPTAADWQLLAKLFAGEQEPFRHHLSLARGGAPDFYAPTAEAASIRALKQGILDAAGGGQYLIETEEGRPAFGEFLALLSCESMASPADARTLNRAAALALEPDCVVLAPLNWRVMWANVCFPTRWSLAGKRLQPLPDIHALVPGLNAELGRKIGVFFDRLAPGEGWGRANWGLSTSAERNQHPSLPYTPLALETPLAQVWVRLESQHLLKLRLSGCIVFGIRIVNFPLLEVARRASIAAGLKSQLRTMPAEVAAYKGIPQTFWERL